MSTQIIAVGGSSPAKWRHDQVGPNVSENGDSFLLIDQALHLPGCESRRGFLFAVADGLGGEGHDDIASTTAMEELDRVAREREYTGPPGERPSSPDAWMRYAISRVNDAVCQEREKREIGGCFTTLTAALVLLEGDRATLYPGQVGDSRLYLLRNGHLRQLSRDDGEGGFISRVVGDPHLFQSPSAPYAITYARHAENRQAMLGHLSEVIGEAFDARDRLSPEVYGPLFLGLLEDNPGSAEGQRGEQALQALEHALGRPRLRSLLARLVQSYQTRARELAAIDLSPDDLLLLCSDGISNAFDTSFLERILDRALESASSARGLESALETFLTTPGRVDDDRTLILVRIMDSVSEK